MPNPASHSTEGQKGQNMRKLVASIPLLLLLAIFAAAQSAPRSSGSEAIESPDQAPLDEDASSSPTGAKLDLADFLSAPQLWELSVGDYIEKSGRALAQGSFKDELVSGYLKKRDTITFLGARLAECVFRLEGGRLKNIYLLLDYSESDTDLDRIARTNTAVQALIAHAVGSPGTPMDFLFPDSRAIRIREWSGEAARIRLYCNAESSDGAYCSALIERPDAPDLGMVQRLGAKKAYFDSHRLPSTENVLDIPMRHQLPGIGACWSATLTRQLDYLGSEIEPQMMAQMVQGDENKLLSESGVELGIYSKRYRLYSADSARANAVALLKNYNTKASASGADPIPYKDDGKKLVYGDNFINMDTSILKSIPVSDAGKYELFRKVVIAAVDHGIPVGWGVVRWEPLTPMKATGHRRMIIGYDLAKDRLVFSDPWGLKYERRTMAFQAGFEMTDMLEILCPDWISATEFPAERR